MGTRPRVTSGAVPRRVLVTGAGGPAGVAVLEELRRLGHVTIAVDADADSAGAAFADQVEQVPLARDPTFVDELAWAGFRHGADSVILTTVEELAAVSTRAGPLRDHHIGSWVPHLDALTGCVDKLRFAQVMSEAGIPSPVTSRGCERPPPGPWVVKPRRGRGSRDVLLVDDARDLDAACRLVPDAIVQARCSGREFTADCLVDRSGRVRAVVPRWRTETRGGISTKGTTFRDPAVDDAVCRVIRAVGLTGTSNVQGMVDHDGQVCIIEVNPRFSGGLPLSLAAGADLVGQHLAGLHGEPIDDAQLTFRPGVSMVRWFAQSFS